MKVEIEITGSELTLLYLVTGNENAGRIVVRAAQEVGKLEPKKLRKPRERKERAQ
jgi:hypothetical protein